MILALGFFINGTLNAVDYREFIRTNSLSHEHLIAAKHFLQRDRLFTEEVEIELLKWYTDFANLVMNTVQHGNYFETRHEFVYESSFNNSREYGAAYLHFMKESILPRIGDFQSIIRKDIRFDSMMPFDTILTL